MPGSGATARLGRDGRPVLHASATTAKPYDILNRVWSAQQVHERLRELTEADPQFKRFGADWNYPHHELEQQQPGFLAMPFPHSEPFLPEPGNGEDLYYPSWLAGSLVLAEFGCGPDFHDWYQTWLDNPKP
jgi:hypothetical protein